MDSTQIPSPPPPSRPRLERLRSDRAIAGVASGLARYLAVDVAWVRIAFVVAAIFGGTGLLLYLIAWVAMPDEGEHASIASDKARDFEGAGSWIGLALIVLAGLIIIGNTGLVDGELVFAAVLVAFGVLLYRGDVGRNIGTRKEHDQPTESRSYEPQPYEPAAPVATPVAEDPVSYGQATVVDPPWSPDPAFQPQPKEPRESSPLGRFAMATLLIVIGVMGVGQSSGWWEPSLRHYAAAVLVVIGAGLLVSSVVGRARWLIVLGLALSPVLLAFALLRVPFEGGFGEFRYAPQSVAEIDEEYRMIAGEMVIDLTSLDLSPGDVYEIEASVVFGRLEVIVPADLGFTATASLDVGELELAGTRNNDNFNVDRSVSFDGTGDIVFDAHVGFGELVINEVQETTP